MSEYEKNAIEFLKRNNIRFTQKDATVDYPDWDKNHCHYLHVCRFYNRNTKKSMTVKFFGSVQDYYDGKEIAGAYSVLACLIKCDVGTIDDFMHEFGYEINSYEDYKKLEKTYKAVKREYANVKRVFADCLDELAEIN